jgi:hypothetical protein
VSATPAKRLLSHGWLYSPAACPIGGGMIKLCGGSTWAAVAVGAAPYALCAPIYLVFVLGYLAAVVRYLFSDADGQEAMAHLITMSADAVVSILTLTRAPRADRAGQHARDGRQVPARAVGVGRKRL